MLIVILRTIIRTMIIVREKLIIFNKNKDHTRVLQAIAEALPTHPRFKRDLGRRDESHFRSVFRHPNDDQRDIYVAVLAFHIPTPVA